MATRDDSEQINETEHKTPPNSANDSEGNTNLGTQSTSSGPNLQEENHLNDDNNHNNNNSGNSNNGNEDNGDSNREINEDMEVTEIDSDKEFIVIMEFQEQDKNILKCPDDLDDILFSTVTQYTTIKDIKPNFPRSIIAFIFSNEQEARHLLTVRKSMK